MVTIELPEAYPFTKPVMRFVTKVWHPNVSSADGSMCLFRHDWSEVMTLSTMIMCAQLLLAEPEPEDAHDVDVAEQFVRDYDAFCATAQAWTQRHGRSLQPNNGFYVEIPRPEGWSEGHAGGSSYTVTSRQSDKNKRSLQRVQAIVDGQSHSMCEGEYLEIMTELQKLYDAM